MSILKRDPIGENKNHSSFVHHMKKKWRAEAGKDMDKHNLIKVVFCTMVLDGLPEKAKCKLDGMVGLAEKGFEEFVVDVVHAVEKHRQAEHPSKGGSDPIERTHWNSQENRRQ